MAPYAPLEKLADIHGPSPRKICTPNAKSVSCITEPSLDSKTQQESTVVVVDSWTQSLSSTVYCLLSPVPYDRTWSLLCRSITIGLFGSLCVGP